MASYDMSRDVSKEGQFTMTVPAGTHRSSEQQPPELPAKSPVHFDPSRIEHSTNDDEDEVEDASENFQEEEDFNTTEDKPIERFTCGKEVTDFEVSSPFLSFTHQHVNYLPASQKLRTSSNPFGIMKLTQSFFPELSS
jgi:hypothetical protein